MIVHYKATLLPVYKLEKPCTFLKWFKIENVNGNFFADFAERKKRKTFLLNSNLFRKVHPKDSNCWAFPEIVVSKKSGFLKPIERLKTPKKTCFVILSINDHERLEKIITIIWFSNILGSFFHQKFSVTILSEKVPFSILLDAYLDH